MYYIRPFPQFLILKLEAHILVVFYFVSSFPQSLPVFMMYFLKACDDRHL